MRGLFTKESKEFDELRGLDLQESQQKSYRSARSTACCNQAQVELQEGQQKSCRSAGALLAVSRLRLSFRKDSKSLVGRQEPCLL